MGRFFGSLAEAVVGAPDFASLVEDGLVFAHRAVGEHIVLQKILVTEPERLLPLLTTEQHRPLEFITGYLMPFLEREDRAGRLLPGLDQAPRRRLRRPDAAVAHRVGQRGPRRPLGAPPAGARPAPRRRPHPGGARRPLTRRAPGRDAFVDSDRGGRRRSAERASGRTGLVPGPVERDRRGGALLRRDALGHHGEADGPPHGRAQGGAARPAPPGPPPSDPGGRAPGRGRRRALGGAEAPVVGLGRWSPRRGHHDTAVQRRTPAVAGGVGPPLGTPAPVPDGTGRFEVLRAPAR